MSSEFTLAVKNWTRPEVPTQPTPENRIPVGTRSQEPSTPDQRPVSCESGQRKEADKAVGPVSRGRSGTTSVNHRKLLSNSFNKLHEQLSIMRSHLEAVGDPAALKHLESMEFGLFAPMRRLRLHLDIPYDWHEKRPLKGEAAP